MKKNRSRYKLPESNKETHLKEGQSETHIKLVRLFGLLLFFLAFLLYIKSVLNGYALDDYIVILKNRFTQKGLAGIGDILSKDTFAGMTEDNIMGLSGGRYRPLSLITFAIEHQFFGNAPGVSHAINVIINAFNSVLIFLLLLKFKTSISTNSWLKVSFVAAILFTVLPAHSESVINIKGRDDLLCLFFFLLASLRLFQYASIPSSKNLIISCLLFFLSLLSKENALTFIAIFPLFLFFFSRAENKIIRNTTIAYAGIGIAFLFFRYIITKDNSGNANQELLNNPFLFATLSEKFATLFFASTMYFKLIMFPIYMSYDYNFNQFPIMVFNDWRVLFSILLHLALITVAIIFFKRKSLFSFGILFYFITFSIVSNFFFNIGTIFADRFIYISSLGFCLIVATAGHWVYDWLKRKLNLNTSRYLFLGGFTALAILYTIRIQSRIGDWENNNTLFLADVDDAPESVKVRINACLAYLELSKDKTGFERDSILNRGIPELEKAISIYPSYATGYLNMGVIYNWKGETTKAEEWWNKARMVDPTNSKLMEYDKVLASIYLNNGIKLGTEKKFNEAVRDFLHAFRYDSLNEDLLYNLGGAYYTINRFDSASHYWNKALLINPSNNRVKEGLNALSHIQK